MPEEFEELDGWMSITDAATRLGFTRQNLHKRINSGSIPAEHVRQIGESGNRKILVIRVSYIDMLALDYGTETKEQEKV